MNTESGRDMLANHGYSRPVSAAWITAIEKEAVDAYIERLKARIEERRAFETFQVHHARERAWNRALDAVLLDVEKAR